MTRPPRGLPIPRRRGSRWATLIEALGLLLVSLGLGTLATWAGLVAAGVSALIVGIALEVP